ncbi:uncharacterized protein LOC113510784 isoform X2 [Galleria mellonella]|uniref:Uncharacterized protein LOC113510784 isoform X2 n=1 Tax=Galleria mellonella TaxID=7137 RepID=A0ABM3N499_GALME|nr:uncharacterized protein LOC113510784 isoform X2 [Galleria mellonella]XP_052758419.1 uncharacterized protein LOC113510784 isoform X2 [Galleria mellonella]
MGVFKWLRRERVTVTTRHNVPPESTTPEEQQTQSATQVGTIRTEEYKRDLAEFQARRSVGNKELQITPEKKKCGRHSLPVSCTNCTADLDNSFNYEKKSGVKYKQKIQSKRRSATSEERDQDGVPNIQFLFQNQVFMPGDLFGASYTEPPKSKRQTQQTVYRSPETDFIVHKQLDFNDEDLVDSPKFYKNNSLPFDVKNFLDGSRSDDGDESCKLAGDLKVSSQSSSECARNDGCEDKLWEVMSELKKLDRWADEQLVQSPNTTRSEDNKSDASAYGLPIASASNLDITIDHKKCWNLGKWGVIPVQIKRLTGVSIEHVKRKRNTEINILRKCRHPNIILLMGLYPDVHNDIQLICERCVDTLYGILHIQGRMLSAQTSVQYALDIANALVFLRMQGYIHTDLTSASIMISNHGAAKLADLGPCVKLPRVKEKAEKNYDLYSPEPQYVNIEDTRESKSVDCEPLLSNRSSEDYLLTNAVGKPYKVYCNSEHYRWQAPELFEPNEDGFVHPCCRSDVYSLCLVLWESCNAAIPWRSYTYDKLKEQYTLWTTGMPLPQDGTYPGSLLALLQDGLKLRRIDRIDVTTLQDMLQNVKRNLDELEYIIIPAKLSKKKSTFSSAAWDTTSPTDSDSQTPLNIEHKAVVHNERDTSTESENWPKSDDSLLYETITNIRSNTYAVPEKFPIGNNGNTITIKYDHFPEKDYSSVCSTPITKIKAKYKDMGTPGALHRSDSTEYCSILSPNRTVNFGLNPETIKDQNEIERPTAKLSRSFTPKSYKPLHIKVPEFNLDSIKALVKDQNENERSSYNFDIKNYSLPTTPIARSNKLRKNAWLSGDLSVTKRSTEKLKESDRKTLNEQEYKTQSSPETSVHSTNSFIEKDQDNVSIRSQPNLTLDNVKPFTPDSLDTRRNSLKSTEPTRNSTSDPDELSRERSNSWSYKSSPEHSNTKSRIDEELLAGLSVKPLVAIHERWIYEANKKTGRSMSLPEDNKLQTQAVKPASHCVDTLQKSLPQLSVKRPAKSYRTRPVSPNVGKNGGHWEQFCQTRDIIAKNINFPTRDTERFFTWKKDVDKCTIIEEDNKSDNGIKMGMTDQATETNSIEEFIRDLIRKEFQHLLQEMSDDNTSSSTLPKEDALNKGVANIMENLKNGDDSEQTAKKETIKSFSRVKINGNNKPLLQITFSRCGENSLQVLDNCVNVTICDTNNGKKLNESMEDTLIGDDYHVNSLKRCQAFNAIQEARSTEDLYIDDDFSTQMQENFGGKVKLIPLHGSLHEILCEKEDECCLIKVKQENGCDTIYFRCDNSDTESRDAIDGCGVGPQDTVVFKRSISLIEERIQRIFPKEKRSQTPVTAKKVKTRNVDSVKIRPKSEIFVQNLNKESRIMSNSSPSLLIKDDNNDEVEVNIENVMCYQDSSSEECLKCQAENDDFELLERKIEEDMANGTLSSLTCGCLEKISEENLSVLNEEMTDRD